MRHARPLFARIPTRGQNGQVRIDVRNLDRQLLFVVRIDPNRPPSMVNPEQGETGGVYLNWDQVMDDHQHLRRCPVCGCREIFVRKDFPQKLGLALLITAVLGSFVLLAMGRPMKALALLGGMVIIDAIVYLFIRRCLVCYRCRSEFRNVKIRRGHPSWELAIGEKYRTQAKRGEATKGM